METLRTAIDSITVAFDQRRTGQTTYVTRFRLDIDAFCSLPGATALDVLLTGGRGTGEVAVTVDNASF